MAQVEMICWCGDHYFAREADLKRGWGLSCCKAHAAARKYGKPTGRRADGAKVNVDKTKVIRRTYESKPYDADKHWEEYLDSAHPFSSEALGQWE